MTYLLDTHTLIWTLFYPNKLSQKVSVLIQDASNNIYVSAISYWEISLKYSLGKLELSGIKPENIPSLVDESGFMHIKLDLDPAASFYQLPREKHSDPFGRMLVWQAMQRDYSLISKDKYLAEYVKYGLKIVW